MSAAPTRPDVLVVGGGVIGCALARELAGRGISVTLLERASAGEEASAAAAGLLSPQSENPAPGPLFEIGLTSLRLFPDWTAALEAETGQTVGYRRTGVLRLAFDEFEAERLRAFLWQADRGLTVELWEPARIREEFAARIAPAARAGASFPDEGVVDPRRLTRALAASAGSRGVAIREGTRVQRFWIEEGRCLGVEAEGERLSAGAVVDAAGAWAGFDDALPFPVPVEPVRGQIVELNLGADEPSTVLHSERAYVVPQGGGRVLVGSTIERAGYRKEVTAGALGELTREAARLLPSVETARFVTAWAGLRPGTPDGLPMLGSCGVEGLYFATGHYRNGVLLAPVTALLVADRILGGKPPALAPFAPERFVSARSEGSAGTARPAVFR